MTSALAHERGDDACGVPTYTCPCGVRYVRACPYCAGTLPRPVLDLEQEIERALPVTPVSPAPRPPHGSQLARVLELAGAPDGVHERDLARDLDRSLAHVRAVLRLLSQRRMVVPTTPGMYRAAEASS